MIAGARAFSSTLGCSVVRLAAGSELKLKLAVTVIAMSELAIYNGAELSILCHPEPN